MNKIAESLYTVRISKGLTQKDLALKSGVPQPNISQIEKGRDFKVSTLCQLAAALNLKPADLLEGVQPLPLDRKKFFSRDNIENVAACLAGKAEVSSEFTSVVKHLEVLIGKKKGYHRKKDLYLSWALTKRTFSREELNTILARFRRAQKRVNYTQRSGIAASKR